jgi:two-component system cell cycle response regulator DivK
MAARQRSSRFGGRPSTSSAARDGGSRSKSAARAESPRQWRGRKCILIVEDHPLNMKLFRALLETRSYRTLEAREGYPGLDLAREHDPDLIIMDVELPDVSGIEIIRALKTDERTRHIPVVAITASMPYDEGKIRAAGADGFMTKPIIAGEFLATIGAFLEEEREE